jgi:hypothetical protein
MYPKLMLLARREPIAEPGHGVAIFDTKTSFTGIRSRLTARDISRITLADTFGRRPSGGPQEVNRLLCAGSEFVEDKHA